MSAVLEVDFVDDTHRDSVAATRRLRADFAHLAARVECWAPAPCPPREVWS